jgi:hypothetical protein
MVSITYLFLVAFSGALIYMPCTLPYRRYIIGVAAMGTQPPDVEAARHHFSTALDMMDAIKESCRENGEVSSPLFTI